MKSIVHHISSVVVVTFKMSPLLFFLFLSVALINGKTVSMKYKILKIKLYLFHAVFRTQQGRQNIVLRHSVSQFPSNFGGIACCVAELHAALCLDTRAKKWKYKLK